VPRDVMWLILSKYGVPEKLISLIRSFHDDMQAEISVGDNVAQVVVSNGLRQGCVLAPTLFVLFFNMVIQCWRDRCQGLGIKLLYKCGGKLVGERTRTPLESWLTEMCFADDVAIMAPTKNSMVKATVELDRVVRACGLTISIPKTKLLVAGRNITQNDLDPISIGDGIIEIVSSFRYLGSVVEHHGDVCEELSVRVSHAAAVFGALHRSVFGDGSLSIFTKSIVYKVVMLGVLLYAGQLSRESYTQWKFPSSLFENHLGKI